MTNVLVSLVNTEALAVTNQTNTRAIVWADTGDLVVKLVSRDSLFCFYIKCCNI